MVNNNIEKYELINGKCIVDHNFSIMTANEPMYRFIGDSGLSSIISIIHQVDLDDFTDVCNNIRVGAETSMVLRMRRCDNSYRWVLLHIKLKEHIYSNSHTFEYFELELSDILAMKIQNDVLKKNLYNFRHLLAMENELFFTYDYETDLLEINRFIDNEIHNVYSLTLDKFEAILVDEKYVAKESMEELLKLVNHIRKGTVSYTHRFQAVLLSDAIFREFEVTGNTIYQEMKPVRAIGNIKGISEKNTGSLSVKTYEYSNDYPITYSNVKDFCIKNIEYNPACNLTLVMFEVKDIEKLMETEGELFAHDLTKNILQITSNLVGYRGAVCRINDNLFSLAIRDLTTEIDIRAFILALRNQIMWTYKLMNPKYNLELYFGIAGYPNNGTDLGRINRKLVKALTLAENKHRGCFVIYKEHLHGELL